MGMSKEEKQAHYAKFHQQQAEERARRQGVRTEADGSALDEEAAEASSSQPANTYKGLNGILVLEDDGIVIKRGGRGFLVQRRLRGDKHIR